MEIYVGALFTFISALPKSTATATFDFSSGVLAAWKDPKNVLSNRFMQGYDDIMISLRALLGVENLLHLI